MGELLQSKTCYVAGFSDRMFFHKYRHSDQKIFLLQGFVWKVHLHDNINCKNTMSEPDNAGFIPRRHNY